MTGPILLNLDPFAWITQLGEVIAGDVSDLQVAGLNADLAAAIKKAGGSSQSVQAAIDEQNAMIAKSNSGIHLGLLGDQNTPAGKPSGLLGAAAPDSGNEETLFQKLQDFFNEFFVSDSATTIALILLGLAALFLVMEVFN